MYLASDVPEVGWEMRGGRRWEDQWTLSMPACNCSLCSLSLSLSLSRRPCLFVVPAPRAKAGSTKCLPYVPDLEPIDRAPTHTLDISIGVGMGAYSCTLADVSNAKRKYLQQRHRLTSQTPKGMQQTATR